MNWLGGLLVVLVQVSVEALISVSGKVYYSSKTKKIFLTRCLQNLFEHRHHHLQANATGQTGRRWFRNSGDFLEKIPGNQCDDNDENADNDDGDGGEDNETIEYDYKLFYELYDFDVNIWPQQRHEK